MSSTARVVSFDTLGWPDDSSVGTASGEPLVVADSGFDGFREGFGAGAGYGCSAGDGFGCGHGASCGDAFDDGDGSDFGAGNGEGSGMGIERRARPRAVTPRPGAPRHAPHVERRANGSALTRRTRINGKDHANAH